MKFHEIINNSQILSGINKMNIYELTEVQEKVIPLASSGSDIICQAPTGTGKTLAFAIPILEKIKASNKPQAVIIAPTRELANQIATDINTASSEMLNTKAIAVYGGEPIDKQIYNLKKKPQVIVATPGRLIDHLERRTIKLSDVGVVVLDEADEMLNMGFIEDIRTILNVCPKPHQTMLFSATISKDIEAIAQEFLVDPVTIRVNSKELTIDLVHQYYIDVKEKDKIEAMSRILDINDYKLVMVFCNTKKTVDEVTSGLLMKGFLVEALHGDMRQMQRDRVMARFRSGQINILVASDVAARGLDISDLDVVFNYDVPQDNEYYVHRIGRTGRAKKEGLSITFVTRGEKEHLREIIKYTKSDISQMMIPTVEKVTKYRVKKVIREALEETSSNDIVTRYVQKEMDKLEGVDKDLLITGLISLELRAKNDNSTLEIASEIEERNEQRNTKMIRIFVNVGKKDKLKVYNLTDLLTKKTDLSNKEIDNVEIHDNFSFFDIPESYKKDLVNSSLEYKNIPLKFEVAKDKRKTKSKSKKK